MKETRKKLIVLGAGDNAKIVIATIKAQGEYTVFGLVDDNEEKKGNDWFGHPVLGGVDHLLELKDHGASHAVVAVGDNFARARLAELVTQVGLQLATVIHPRTIIIEGAEIGEGSVILADAHIGADVRVGLNVLVSVRGLVAHDCVVGNHCQVGPGAILAGHVYLGDYSLIGMGASVLPRVTVGRKAVVGANAAVIEDVPNAATVVGVPARAVGSRKAQVSSRIG
jgi:sugar O-acyltransferase (sialic acid O-acetyltransferase NeuD family)